MIRLLKLVAVSALGCVAWNVYSHGGTVSPPDGILVEDRPLQHNYVDDKPPIKHGAWTLVPRAHYRITGRVLQHVLYTDDWWKDLAPIEPGMSIPPVLVVSPPPIGYPRGPVAQKFSGAEKRCAGLAEVYRQVSSDLACHFFDAGSVTPASLVDGIHLDAQQHVLLGQALAHVVAPILSVA